MAAAAFTAEEKIFTVSPEHPKPWLHKLITDIVVFGPAAVFLLIPLDLYLNPIYGWRNWLIYTGTGLLFLLVGTKMRTLGISLGYHRGGTHPSYKTHWWVRATFYLLGNTNGQGKMVNWLSDHWHHHIHSDTPEDLHSPRHGFWHAYFGWLRGLLINRYTYEIFRKDKMIMFFSNTVWLWLAFGLVFAAYIGWITGFGSYRGFLYGGLFAIFLANQVTYWVNAGCHKYGKRNFQTDDDSTNFWLDGFWGFILSWILAWLSWGETNHNNHHGVAKSANHGMRKGEFDPSANLLRVLERMRLVWDVEWTYGAEAEELMYLSSLSNEEKKQYMREKHGVKPKQSAQT